MASLGLATQVLPHARQLLHQYTHLFYVWPTKQTLFEPTQLASSKLKLALADATAFILL